MDGVRLPKNNDALPDSLWPDVPLGGRSKRLSPIYVVRYCGVHSHTVNTRHPCWELIFLNRGRLTLHTAQGEVELTPGSACLIPAGLEHHEESRETTEVFWVGLVGTRLGCCTGDGPVVGSNAGFSSLVEILWERSTRLYSAIGPELDGLTMALVEQVFRVAGEREADSVDLIDTAVTYLNRYFDSDLSISQVANHIGMSEGHFYRLFRRRLGQTPRAYLTGLRLQRSVRYLQQTHLPIERISRMCGFRDPLYFSRAFRKHFGSPPSQTRKGFVNG